MKLGSTQKSLRKSKTQVGSSQPQGFPGVGVFLKGLLLDALSRLEASMSADDQRF